MLSSSKISYSEFSMLNSTMYKLSKRGCFDEYNSKMRLYDIKIIRRKTASYSNKVYQIVAYVRSKNSCEEMTKIPLIAKISRNYLYFVPCTFKNERLFYEMIAPHLKRNYVPRYYMDVEIPYDPPVLILENVMTIFGYMAKINTLSKNHLKMCMKILAQFHADMMKLKKEDNTVFMDFRNTLYGVQNNLIKQKKAIR